MIVVVLLGALFLILGIDQVALHDAGNGAADLVIAAVLFGVWHWRRRVNERKERS